MKNFKKVLALVLAVACLLSFAAVASANNAIKTSEVYDDAASISAEYKEALDVLTAIGVLDGKGSSFKPKDTLKRSEAAKIIAVFANTDPEINGLYASANPFTDVPANHWAVSYIAYAYKTGIIAGVKDGVFAPDARLTGIQFLKMVLCTLGFDAHEEGLVGNSWKVNTLQLAKNTGLTTVLGNGFNYDTELTRDAAAQIMLNALNAHTVYYGSENKVAASRNAYTTVAGAVANNEFMYQRWNLTKIANNVTDDFYRPAHEWMYNGVKFDALYTDAPLASYNVKVAGCNILNDAIFDLTNPVGTKTLKVYTNGALTGTTTIVDTTELKYGAQGQLTEIYPDRIVHIDTYLAQVYSVMAGRVDNNGHIYRDANVHADVFVGTNGPVGYTTVKLPFVTEGFTKDQFVRVTKSFKGGEHIVTMDAVETKQGIFNGYTGDMLNGFSQMKVAEEFLNVANCFGYNITRNNIYNWMGIDVVTFMDQYGNVLGIDKYWAALNYGVIDALWIGTENGQPVIKADIVTVGGETLSAVTVSQITRNGSVDKAADFVTKYPNLTLAEANYTGVIGNTNTISAQYAQAFAPYYDRLAFYVVNGAGQYELNLDTNGRFDDETTDHFGALTNVVYAKGGDKVAEFTNNYAWAQEVTTTNGQTTKKSLIPMNADTVILVRNAGTEVPFASRIANGYTSYTGYANVPSMTAYGVSYHINTETRYADVVYVYEVSVTGTKATVFYAGDPIAALPLSYDALGNTIYNYQVIVYVVDEATGALSKATYTMALDERLENGTMSIPAPAIGFHTAYVSANNEISFGIDNANYEIANANFGGNNVTGTVSATYTENPMLGYNAYEISLGNGTEIFNTNATTSSCVFATTFDPSEVATVADIQNDVHYGDKVYVYQNANNPVNPIYAVVVEYAQANITVYYNGHAVAADAVENYIWRFDCAAQNRTWEDLSVEAKFGYEVVEVTNTVGNAVHELVKLPNGLYHDMTVDATVGDIAVYVKNADNIDNSNLVEYTNGPVRAVNVNGAKQLYVYAGTGINVTELLNELNGYNGRIYLNGNASVAVLRNGFNGEEAQGSDTVSTGFVVRVTAENGVNFSDYYVVVAG